MSLLIVYGSTNISSNHLPLIDEKKRKEAFHLHESTPLVGAKTCFVSPFEFPADASISAQRC